MAKYVHPHRHQMRNADIALENSEDFEYHRSELRKYSGELSKSEGADRKRKFHQAQMMKAFRKMHKRD